MGPPFSVCMSFLVLFPKLIGFDKFVKNKKKGDAVDVDIAELLGIDEIAA